MASFDALFPEILRLEGGWRLTQTPGDRGKMTWAGISRRANPNWEGWGIIDEQLNQGVAIKDIAATPELQTMTKTLYRDEYFNRMRLGSIVSEDMAATLFSCAVLSGTYTASILAQAAVGETVDGIIGPNSLRAINNTDNELFDLKFALLRIVRYVEICKKDKSQKRFLMGWVNRALGGAEEWV